MYKRYHLCRMILTFILDEAGFNYFIKRKQCIHGADTHNKKVNLLVIFIYCITAINVPISHTSPSNHTDRILQRPRYGKKSIGLKQKGKTQCHAASVVSWNTGRPLTDRKANYLSHVLTMGSPDIWAGPGGRWEAGQHLNSRDQSDAGERRYWTCIPKHWEWSTRG